MTVLAMTPARGCARPSCSAQAAATLSYDYATSQVWIEHLHLERHPMTHDLCLRHADTLTVPVGWIRRDLRSALPEAVAG